MTDFYRIFETYLYVLIHPYRIHHSLRFQLPLPNSQNFSPTPLTTAESISLSWIFSIMRGFGKLLILNFFLQSFYFFEDHELFTLFPFLEQASLSFYYFFIFSIFLDIIFFPIVVYVTTEVWSWMIRLFAKLLNPDLPRDQIADQITTHALSSNLFVMVPIIGDFIQFILYHFLLYAGLRSNLGATRSLSLVILLTPLALLFMGLTTLSFVIFFVLM